MGLEFRDDKGRLINLQEADIYDGMPLIFPNRTVDLDSPRPNEIRQAITSLNPQPNPPGYGGVIEARTVEGLASPEGLIIKKETIGRVHLAAGEADYVLGRLFKGN